MQWVIQVIIVGLQSSGQEREGARQRDRDGLYAKAERINERTRKEIKKKEKRERGY